MSEMKFNVNGPIGAVLGILIVGGILYYKYFMPFSPTTRDKKAILEKIEELRIADMARISKAGVDLHKNTGKVVDNTKDIVDLSGKIVITDIQGKRGFTSGIKIKVTYTIGGKTPKSDAGILFFKLYRRKRGKSSMRRKVDLTQITEDLYEK